MNRVALVGAGCGRGALTLRGAQLLAACACVVYDSLLDEELLSLVPEGCEKIYVGKRAGAHSLAQEEICALLAECAQKYPLTVRLKGGDPFVFGRGGEELSALLQAGVRCEMVPGVTSAVAAAERFGIPVTHRALARGFTVLTAHTKEGVPDFTRFSASRETLVFLMAKGAAERICRDLLHGGMSADTPCAVISGAGMSAERMARCSLSALADTVRPLPAPVTIVVGMVCAEGLLGAYAPPPRVMVTGTPSHVRRVCAQLAGFGIEPLPCAFRAVVPCSFNGFWEQFAAFSHLVFTSPNGVDVFFAEAARRGVDHRAFAGKRFAVIGPATAAALAQRGFFADLMPETYTVRALAALLVRAGVRRERAALLRAKAGSAALLGCGVQFDVYETRADMARLARAREEVAGAACVTFSSAGGAREFLAACPLPAGVAAVSIGEETAAAVRAAGYQTEIAKSARAEELARTVGEIVCREQDD